MRLGVPVMLSVLVAAAAALTTIPGGAQELRVGCDADLAFEAAQGCGEQRFDPARGGAHGLRQDRLAAASSDADGLRRQFGQADRDGDGRITREEWLQWFGPAHARTTGGPGSRGGGSD